MKTLAHKYNNLFDKSILNRKYIWKEEILDPLNQIHGYTMIEKILAGCQYVESH